MAFESFDAFMMMGGHGPYVWTCYLVFFILSLVLIIWSRKQRRAALQGLARRQPERNEVSQGNTGADFARVDSSRH